jgi:hypothetical protein
MKLNAVIKSLFDQRCKISDCFRRVLGKHLDINITFVIDAHLNNRLACFWFISSNRQNGEQKCEYDKEKS